LDFGWYVHSCILCRVWQRTKQSWICSCLCETTTSTFDAKQRLKFLSKTEFMKSLLLWTCHSNLNKSKGVIFWRVSFSFLESKPKYNTQAHRRWDIPYVFSITSTYTVQVH
jgi:hypothetical protein